MRLLMFLTITALGLCSIEPTRAEQTNSCIQSCRAQQKACLKNYSAATCNTEYGICAKACQRK